jgi:hypothetical protein
MLYDDAPGFDSQHGTANGLSDVWPGSVSFATGSVPAAAKADSPAGWTRNPRQREVLPLLVEGPPIRK